MADKNIQINQRNDNNTDWDNLYPITKAQNVIAADGSTMEALKTKVDKKQDQIIISGTAPSTPYANQIWIDTANGVIKYYSGTAWIALGAVYK